MKSKNIYWVFATALVLSVPIVFLGCSKIEWDSNKTTFGDWVTVTAPTCEDAGMEIRTALSDPSITEMRTVPAIGHDWNAWEKTTEPTCLLAGVETRTCNNCDNFDKRAIPALGHKWKAWETILEADCKNSGTKTRVCERDDSHTEYQSIPQLGHDYSDWVITRAPTCTASGVETRYCRNDNNHTEVRAIEPLGHDYGPTVTTVQATCTEQGETVTVCTHDSTHVITSAVNAHGHNYGEWVISVPATETESGVDIRVCRNDASHTETRVSDPIGSEGLAYALNSAGTAYAVTRTYPYPSGTVYIPATHNGLPVTAIKSNAFMGCKNIKRVVFLGNNIETIDHYAFYNCDKLESIEFPEGVTSIAAFAINKCAHLKSVSFPSTVTNLGLSGGYKGSYIGLIRDCPALESITVAEDNTAYKADNGCLMETATGALLIGTKNAVIPDYATSISKCAFYGCEIESVRIPARVVNIGRTAFSHCKKLREVTFENGDLTSIDGDMGVIFGHCDSLERAVMSDNITYIGRYTFKGCPALREVVLGKNLQTIDGLAFADCNAIEICEIPANVSSISATAFTSTAFTALTIAEENRTYIKDGNCIIERDTDTVVAGCNESIIPAYVKHIGNYAFYERDLHHIVIPNSVLTIGKYAFSECALLESIEFQSGSSLGIIDAYAFESCTSLKNVLLPEKLRVISDRAFYRCEKLSRITFGYSDGMFTYGASALESIGNYAFAETALTSFTIPATVTNIGNGAFTCKNLSLLTVQSDNMAYTVTNGCLYEIETGTVLFAHDGASVPEGAKVITNGAFKYRTNARLYIPSSVEKIYSGAFDTWTNEQTIIIKGFASQEEADAVLGSEWRRDCNAAIIYES